LTIFAIIFTYKLLFIVVVNFVKNIAAKMTCFTENLKLMTYPCTIKATVNLGTK
jgi:hypothetical protein